VLVEHARNLMGLGSAVHAEYGTGGTEIVSLLACSLDGEQITVSLAEESRLRRLHGSETVVEHTTCNYGLNPEWQHIAEEHGMAIAGIDETGEVRAIERTDHPFFVGTLYQPQLSSTPEQPHPIFVALLQAAAAT